MSRSMTTEISSEVKAVLVAAQWAPHHIIKAERLVRVGVPLGQAVALVQRLRNAITEAR